MRVGSTGSAASLARSINKEELTINNVDETTRTISGVVDEEENPITAEESVSDRKTPLLVSVVSQDGGIGWRRGGYPDAIALSNKMEVTCERGHVFRAVATLSVSFWGRAYT